MFLTYFLYSHFLMFSQSMVSGGNSPAQDSSQFRSWSNGFLSDGQGTGEKYNKFWLFEGADFSSNINKGEKNYIIVKVISQILIQTMLNVVGPCGNALVEGLSYFN